MQPATTFPVPPDVSPERTLSAPEWGMVAFLVSEVAFFTTLLVTYVTFIGRDTIGPMPRDVLSLPLVIVSTLCLLASSVTIHLAESSLHFKHATRFQTWWTVTILLGTLFLFATAYEWSELIYEHGLTISRNLFGSTFFTLVGFHALHVTAGVLTMLILLGTATYGHASETAVRLTVWYWHFVDAVWIAVFLIVYVGAKLGTP